jgi:hypothetical protein
MKSLKLIVLVLISSSYVNAQNTNQVNTGKFSGIFTTPRSAETTRADLEKTTLGHCFAKYL